MRLTCSSVAIAIFIAGQSEAAPISSRQLLGGDATNLMGVAGTVLQPVELLGSFGQGALSTLSQNNLLSNNNLLGGEGLLGPNGLITKRDGAIDGLLGNANTVMQPVDLAENLLEQPAEMLGADNLMSEVENMTGSEGPIGPDGLMNTVSSIAKRDNQLHQRQSGLLGSLTGLSLPTQRIGNNNLGLINPLITGPLLEDSPISASAPIASTGNPLTTVNALESGGLLNTVSSLVKRENQLEVPLSGLLGGLTGLSLPTQRVGNNNLGLINPLITGPLLKNSPVSASVPIASASSPLTTINAPGSDRLLNTMSSVIKPENQHRQHHSGLVGDLSGLTQPTQRIGDNNLGLINPLITGPLLKNSPVTASAPILSLANPVKTINAAPVGNGVLNSVTSLLRKRDLIPGMSMPNFGNAIPGLSSMSIPGLSGTSMPNLSSMSPTSWFSHAAQSGSSSSTAQPMSGLGGNPFESMFSKAFSFFK